MTINKSISITGVKGAGINMTSAGAAIEDTGAIATDTINLSNLILDGAIIGGIERLDLAAGICGGGKAKYGVTGNPKSLTITHCTIHNFVVTGIDVASLTFLIADTVLTNNGVGIAVNKGQGTLDHVVANLNGTGIDTLPSGVDVTAVETTASNITGNGFSVSGVVRLAHSTAPNTLAGSWPRCSDRITNGGSSGRLARRAALRRRLHRQACHGRRFGSWRRSFRA
jgi:hypothetical protein